MSFSVYVAPPYQSMALIAGAGVDPAGSARSGRIGPAVDDTIAVASGTRRVDPRRAAGAAGAAGAADRRCARATAQRSATRAVRRDAGAAARDRRDDARDER